MKKGRMTKVKGVIMSIRIVVADDHEILRQGITALIENQSDMKVVGEADNGLNAVAATRRFRPDVVVMDVTMPVLNGIEATRRIKKELPNTKVLALSIHADRKFVMDMGRAGVSGYVVKECAVDDLIRAIRVVMDNQAYLSPRIASIVLKGIARDTIFGAEGRAYETLTAKEKRILRLLTDGMSAKEIASQLGLSVRTIEANRRQIMEKTDVANLADLTKYAIRQGLIAV
jgi:DNA-binding NarL/FixJ family response regulator